MNCKKCDCELNDNNWTIGMRNKSWYICIDCHNKRSRKYRELNPIKSRISSFNSKYKTNITEVDFKYLWDSQEHKCAICKDILTINDKYCIDHIIPRNDKGSSDITNLEILCEKCNVGKHSWSIDEYIKHCIKIAEIYK